MRRRRRRKDLARVSAPFVRMVCQGEGMERRAGEEELNRKSRRPPPSLPRPSSSEENEKKNNSFVSSRGPSKELICPSTAREGGS